MPVWRSLLILFVAGGCFAAGSEVLAQKPGTRPTQKAGQSRPIAITPEREATVTDFVERNHPGFGAIAFASESESAQRI